MKVEALIVAQSDTMAKKNPFLLIINIIFKLFEWPVIGIVTFFKPFVIYLKYQVLGFYYVLLFITFPIRYIFNIGGDTLFKIYKKQDKKNEVHQVVNLDSGDEEFKPKEEEVSLPIIKESAVQQYFKDLYENSYFARKQREQEATDRAGLIKLIQEEARSEMPVTYRYTAISSDGKKEVNTFIAFSKMEVYSYLENENYRVLKIENSKFIEMMYGPSGVSSGKFKNKDLIFWLTQLSTYIKSGIPLTDAMRILGKQMSKDKSKKKVFDAIIYNLTLGEAFSDALAKQDKVFPPLLVNMIKAAEATGELEETLDDMAEYYNDVETTRKQMVSAMSYPLIIMIFSIGVVVFIMLFVIPQFSDIYAETGADLNALTVFILAMSGFLEKNIIIVLSIVILIIVSIFMSYKKIKAFRAFMQRVMMHIPVVGQVIIYKEMAIFAKTFSSLLKNNVFITESIEILTNITNNEVYRDIMTRTITNIAKGDKISDSFKNHWAVPDVAYYMIVTGESTGELAEMMTRVANYYQTSHKAIINTMKSFIEPVMIIFLAVVVGGIVMAVILPMFGLYGQIS